MASKIGDIMHPNGKYVDSEGQEKTRWLRVGSLIEKEGGYRIKLDAVPANMSETDGWLQVFETDDKPYQSSQATAQEKPKDDIPF